MSKLNGMQIFELMSDVNDNLIAESAATAVLLGSAAAGTAAMAGSMSTSAAAPAKAGFGAWLAKGGWVALAAGAVAVTGITVGLLALGGGKDPSPSITPPISETVSDTESLPADTETEEPVSAAPTETESESTSESDPEMTIEVPTEEPTEAPTEMTTEAPTEPATEEESGIQSPLPANAPLRLTDFTDVDLSLFTPSQGKVSVTPEGKLLLEADWVKGSSASSSVAWIPHALMPYAPDYTQSTSYVPGAIVMKYKVVNGDNGQPDFRFKGQGDSDAQATYTHALVYEDWGSDYRYLIIRTDSVASYMSGTQTHLTMNWLYLGNNFATCDGRSMTVEEMLFYPSSTDALLDFSDYLSENGITSEILYSNNDDYCIIYENRQYTGPVLHIPSHAPDGRPVKEITDNAYSRNTFLFLLTVDEGVEYIRRSAFNDCSSLATAYLPDSLIYLGNSVFSSCDALTEIHLGSGLKVMEYGSLPLSSEAFTDIYYNGTIADWYRIVRRNPTAEHAITVHCTDGELDYSDPAPAVLPNIGDEARDLTDILAKAPPMVPEADETLVSYEARVIRLKQGTYGDYKEFVLRYGLFKRGDITRYGFDILSMEDGSIVATPTFGFGMYRRFGAGGMLYFEAAPSGEVDAMIFMYDYGVDTNGNLAFATQYYAIEYRADGKLYITSNYPVSPELTSEGYMDKRLASRALAYSIRVLDTLETDMNNLRYGAHGYYLMSTAPDGTTTLFTPMNAPLFDPTLPMTVRELKLSEVLDPGIPAFHEKYGPRKRE